MYLCAAVFFRNFVSFHIGLILEGGREGGRGEGGREEGRGEGGGRGEVGKEGGRGREGGRGEGGGKGGGREGGEETFRSVSCQMMTLSL